MKMNIYAYKCKKCGFVQYPYRMVCKNCHKNEYNEFEPVPLPKKGKLLTFTELHNPPSDFDIPKITLGIVELEDGNRVTGQLKVDKPEIGMNVEGEVEVVRQDAYEKYMGIVFYKAKK